jgi:DUF1680 family protein
MEVNLMELKFRKIPLGGVCLQPGLLADRAALNRKYMMSLGNENLLQNYYLEAGLWSTPSRPEHIHWGWESPTCQLRGHFLGHWLSAAAQLWAATGDMEVKAKADKIVSELARCQQANGGEWAGSIPEKYLDMIARGQQVWAPQYTLHKTLMGLWDMYAYAGSSQSLEILIRFSEWFHRWTKRFTTEEMAKILDVETGGMLEVWADLYAETKDARHLELLNRYYRPSLFDRLLSGEDALTNQHANTTIPEIIGAARAFEVTGDRKWRDIVENYWEQAVTIRGAYCTGGQTMGEIWTPPFKHSARLGEKNQEHCTVYNMMRLADKLLQWTGDAAYADYWERNLYNGVLAQQNPKTGQITYFLPLNAGAAKKWGSETEDFWCCHGSLVQAHAAHGSCAYYETADGLAVSQYIPTKTTFKSGGISVDVSQDFDRQTGFAERPRSLAVNLLIQPHAAAPFALDVRIPRWAQPGSSVYVNGEKLAVEPKPGTFLRIERRWENDAVRLELGKKLTACPLPDEPDTVAFLDGPVVLAGLCADERTLEGDAQNPEKLLTPDSEREWSFWRNGYRTVGIDHGFRLLPLYEIVDERYQVYFPVRKP